MSCFKAKCTRFNFNFFAPDPADGAHSAPPSPLTGFEGVLFLREGKGMGGKGREWQGRERWEVVSWLLGDGRLCPPVHVG